MKKNSKEGINRFLNTVKKYNLWKSIEVKILAKKKKESWISIVTRILLSRHYYEELDKEISTESLKLIHKILPINDLEQIMNNLIERKIIIKDEEYSLEVNENIKYKVWERPYGKSFGIDWPCISLIAGGPLVNEVIDEYRARTELLTYKEPYENLFVACEEFLGIRNWNACHLHVVAPIYVAIENVKLDDDKVNISIKCHNSLLNKIELSSIIYGEKDVLRKKFIFVEKSAEVVEGDIYRVKEEIRQIPKISKFYLFLDGNEVDSKILSISSLKLNPRIGIHEIFDSNRELFSEWIKGKGRNSEKDFEAAIHWLLHFCGFQSEWLGYAGKALKPITRGMGEFDILAFDPRVERLIMAECTVTPSKISSKINQVYQRISEVKKNFDKFDIIPVIFIPEETDKIGEGVKEEAKKNNIAIIGKKEIEEMQEMILDGKNAEEIFNYLKIKSGKNLISLI